LRDFLCPLLLLFLVTIQTNKGLSRRWRDLHFELFATLGTDHIESSLEYPPFRTPAGRKSPSSGHGCPLIWVVFTLFALPYWSRF